MHHEAYSASAFGPVLSEEDIADMLQRTATARLAELHEQARSPHADGPVPSEKEIEDMLERDATAAQASYADAIDWRKHLAEELPFYWVERVSEANGRPLLMRARYGGSRFYAEARWAPGARDPAISNLLGGPGRPSPTEQFRCALAAALLPIPSQRSPSVSGPPGDGVFMSKDALVTAALQVLEQQQQPAQDGQDTVAGSHASRDIARAQMGPHPYGKLPSDDWQAEAYRNFEQFEKARDENAKKGIRLNEVAWGETSLGLSENVWKRTRRFVKLDRKWKQSAG
jgi:hypothetical protein